MVARAGIALGSNLGDRLSNLRSARDQLRALSSGPPPFLQSSIYSTAPVGCPPGSPDFFNAVVELSFDGSSQELLAATQKIQTRLGRVSTSRRNAPRLIDIDILYLGSIQLKSPRLTIPHPRLTGRLFVLKPLAEINPDLVLVGESVDIATHLSNLVSDEPALQMVETEW